MISKIDTCSIGKSIRALRLKNHLTQVELADLVGYSVRNIRRIENYGTGSIDIVNTFAGAFNVSALDILTEDVFLYKKLLRDEHWRSSPYTTYSNLLFIHKHFRPSVLERPIHY